VATFGFTGELQPDDAVYLRARWYQPSAGTLLGRDPFAGYDSLPYSLHPYQYAYSDPVRLTDPSGKCVEWVWGDPTCQFIGWERILHGDLEWEDGRPWGGAALDFTPGVGDVKGLIEVFTGCDIVTREDLGNWRWAGLLFVSESRQLRHIQYVDEVGPIARQLPIDQVDNISRSAPNSSRARAGDTGSADSSRRLPLPTDWVETVAGSVKTLKGADSALYAIGIQYAEEAKDVLRALPDGIRSQTGIGVLTLNN
jgi:RHS repeat-associated protein